jgi:signal transduction histidine kinase
MRTPTHLLRRRLPSLGMKGQGIAKKDFKTIFEPFRQTGAETEAVYGGTGLGLPITAKLV